MTTEALTRVDPGQFAQTRDAVAALEAASRAADGHDALGDFVWRDFARPGADSAGFFVDDRAYAHVARAEGDDPAAWAAASVHLPDARDAATTTALLDAVVAHTAAHGARTITCWRFGATDADDAVFAAAGFRPERTLYEMRGPLPETGPASWPAGVRVRSFVPARGADPGDERAWLALNNRAFAGQPDQGGWTEATLHGRMSEAWFDPTLFLVATDAAGLAGFNWCKLHPARDPDPVLGEIYVIGVDPRSQGTGLGRALAIAGLHALRTRGAETGLLFCSAANTGALALYRSIGFTVHRTDRAYQRDLA